MNLSSKIRVGILRGGTSPAYEESLQTGSYLIKLLNEIPETYEPVDIFVSREGVWYHGGIAISPHEVLEQTDVIWNALHGKEGESGEMARLLEHLERPFVGSGVVASALAHNKDLTKDVYKLHSLKTPQAHIIHEEFYTEADLIKAFRELLHPVVVKPATGVRGLGVRMARTFQELKEAVKETFKHSPKVVVEEYISGTIVTCSVIEGTRGEVLYALTPTHLETEYRRVRPRPEENREIERMARLAHEGLGLRHYSSSDFVVTPRGQIYIIETNSQPLFHPGSMLHDSLSASGFRPHYFVEHCLELVLKRKA